MKVFYHNDTRYTVTRCGHGQYYVSNGDRKIYTTDSKAYDAIDDEDDFDCEFYRMKFVEMFKPQEVWYGH